MSFYSPNPAFAGDPDHFSSVDTSNFVGLPPVTQAPASIRKSIFGIGQIEYKMVSSRCELEGAMALVLNEYSRRGLIRPQHHKSALYITNHHLLPQMRTFVALKGGEVVATCSVIPDSPFGLPVDTGYYQQVKQLRREGRQVVEIGYMAVKHCLFNKDNFSMFNFNKLDFLLTLLRPAVQYACFEQAADDLCTVVSPKTALFKILPFSAMGAVRCYGVDDPAVNKTPVLGKRIDLRHLRLNLAQGTPAKLSRTVARMFFVDRLPGTMFQHAYRMTLDDLRYFFVDRSDIWAGLNRQEEAYVLSQFPY